MYSQQLLILLFFQQAMCYFAATHMFLGKSLTDVLHDKYSDYTFYHLLNKTIDISTFSKGSIWADKVKNRKEYSWSRHHHYIDIEKEMCTQNNITNDYIKKLCNNDCIYTSFLNITNDLKFNRPWIQNTTEALYFLIHFLQDFHQPMHVYGQKRGGNDIRINLNYFGKTIRTNLHTLWDKIIPEYYIKNSKIIKTKEIVVYDNLNINSMYLFEDYLFNHTINLFRLACNITQFKLSDNNSIDLVFTEYYNEYYIKNLFDMYIQFSITILRYIFQNSTIIY